MVICVNNDVCGYLCIHGHLDSMHGHIRERKENIQLCMFNIPSLLCQSTQML